ncbi:MAG: TRAP transporter small permease [Candidatus Bathyarchaeia archaeon]
MSSRWCIKICEAFSAMGGLFFLCMIVITSYGVVRRYFLCSPEPYSLELNTILLLWSFMLALPHVEMSGGHIRADFLLQKLPKTPREMIYKYASPVCGMVYSAILCWRSFVNALHSYFSWERSMSIVAEPLFPIKMVIPICYGMVTSVIVLRYVSEMADEKREARQCRKQEGK